MQRCGRIAGRRHRNRAIRARGRRLRLAATLLLAVIQAPAGPLAAPGDLGFRHDLQWLDDAGAIHIPLTTWPLAWADLLAALDAVDVPALTPAGRAAYQRLRRAASAASARRRPAWQLSAAMAREPRRIRGFEDTPREVAQAGAGIDWHGAGAALRLRLTVAADAGDGDTLRADGSYAGVALGNWWLTAGWQERWWGPGRDGSLILSGNARPVPALALQRKRSTAFASRWLAWLGPWTATAFIGRLDDRRRIDNALLFGLRTAFRPWPSLEIGLSRSAQWCGENRPCSLSTFGDLLLGNDNRGVNVDPEDEPGNQLGGADLRWAIPRMPLALYAQWIAEDTRRGGPEIGSWLRQVGIEVHGTIGGLPHRTHVEVAQTGCRDGGLGFSDLVADCAYEHGIYRSGYRYRGRAIGHAMDGDGLSFSFGSTLVQSAGHAWSVAVRHMEINRSGQASARHTLSALPQERLDVQFSHQRRLARGALHAGIGYRRIDDVTSGERSNDVTGFIRWSTQ